MRNLYLLPLCLWACTAIAQPARVYSSFITPAALKEKLSFIAGPETQGRQSATHGQRVAATYIENNFRSYGLQPGTPGGYQMVFPVYQDTLMDQRFTVYGKAFSLNQDLAFSVSSMPSHNLHISQVAFAGYGTADSTRNDFAGLDVKGKWVMMLEPAQQQQQSGGMRRQMAQFSRILAVMRKGATGVLFVSEDFPLKQPVTTISSKRKKSFPDNLIYNISPAVASAILNTSAATKEELAKLTKGDYKTDVQSYVYKRKITLPSTNVVGVLPGTDKKDEYVFLTAHYDHGGHRTGWVYPWAEGCVSVTAAVLKRAGVFEKAAAEGYRPRRSIVFMTVSGEELGLLGSDFYTRNPIFPLAKTSVNLNIDMIGRIDPAYKGDSMNYVYVIGDDRISSELRPITDSANQMVKLEIDRRFNGSDPQRYYFRSDHYNFARKGVPIIFYFNGTHRDYHRPGDTIDKIQFDLMSRRAQLVFHTAWNIANRETMLPRNIELKE